jgi:hypothetical protein
VATDLGRELPRWLFPDIRSVLVTGMAATEENGATRCAFLGGVLGPLRLCGPIARPLRGRNGPRARIDEHDG